MQYRRSVFITLRTVFITVVFISAAWSPSGAQSTSLVRRGTVAGSASTMAASAQLLAIADGSTVRMIDVSRPGSAVVVGEHTFTDDVLALAVDGSTVYVANSHEGLHLLDVSNSSAPAAQDVSPTRGQAVGVAVSGEHVAPVMRGRLRAGGRNGVGAAVAALVAVSNRQTRDFVRGSEGR